MKTENDQTREPVKESLLRRWTDRLAKEGAPTFMIMTRRTRAVRVTRGNKRSIQLSAKD